MKRYINKLLNIMYNYKRKYIFLLVFAQKFAKFLCVVSLLSLAVLTLSSAAEYGTKIPEMSIETKVSDGRIVLSITSGDLLCGFVGELEYDRDSFVFLGAEKSECLDDGFCLSYIEKDGKVRFLFDGDRNIGKASEIISFFFDYLGEDGEMFAFSVYPADPACYFKDNALVPVETKPFGVAVKCWASKPEEKKAPLVILSEVFVTDGEKLRLVCEYSGNFCFCGLKISVVGLETQEIEQYRMSGALPAVDDKTDAKEKRSFFFDVEIPEGDFVIIATPAVYGRNITQGEPLAYYFSAGRLVEY